PSPAGSTQPSRTSSMAVPAPLSASAARSAVAPSSLALAAASAPWKAPIGVRRAAAMTRLTLLQGHLVAGRGSLANVRLTGPRRQFDPREFRAAARTGEDRQVRDQH